MATNLHPPVKKMPLILKVLVPVAAIGGNAVAKSLSPATTSKSTTYNQSGVSG